MKTIKWSGVVAGLLLGIASVSFGQVYGPGNRQSYPNDNGYNPNYPNGYGNGQNYPNQSYPYGSNNGYGQPYPNGYGQAYPNGYAYDQYGRPYPVQPPVVIVPPRVVIVPPPPRVVYAPPVIIRPYAGYRGYGYRSGRGGYGRRW